MFIHFDAVYISVTYFWIKNLIISNGFHFKFLNKNRNLKKRLFNYNPQSRHSSSTLSVCRYTLCREPALAQRRTVSPVAKARVASVAPTIHGNPYSRAITAPNSHTNISLTLFIFYLLDQNKFGKQNKTIESNTKPYRVLS